MTVSSFSFPSLAKIVEARLGIEAAGYGSRSSLDRRMPTGPVANEIWRGELLLATLSPADIRTLQAGVHELAGKVSPFLVPMYAPLLSNATSQTGTLAATTTRQSGTITVNMSAGAVVRAGTLAAIGATTDDNYQFVEVLADFTPGTGVSVSIAPRMRAAVASGTAIAFGNVDGRFILASDDVFHSQRLDRGDLVLPIEEYL